MTNQTETSSKQEKPYIEDVLKKQKRQKQIVLAGQFGCALLLLVLWEVLTRIGFMDSYYWSSPLTIIQTAQTAFTDGGLWGDLVYTSLATITGFAAGTGIGAIFGLSFWWSILYSRISEPYLIAFNAVPKLALGPVIVILFGIGFFSKVMLAFMMTVIVTALAAHSGVKAVDDDLVKLMYSLGAKRRHVFAKVVIPTAMPWIVSSLRVNIALALAGTIVGEFISSRQGIGRMILYAGQILDIDLVWVGVCVLSILSLIMYAATVSLEKLLLRGHHQR